MSASSLLHRCGPPKTSAGNIPSPQNRWRSQASRCTFGNFTKTNVSQWFTKWEMTVYCMIFLSKRGKKFVGWPTKRLNPPCGHGEKHPHRGFPWQTLKGQQSSACLFFKKTTLMKNLQRKCCSSIKIQSFHQIHTQTSQRDTATNPGASLWHPPGIGSSWWRLHQSAAFHR